MVGTHFSGVSGSRPSSTYSILLSTRHPAWWNTDRTVARCRQSTPLSRTRPPAAAVADSRVAATMRSPITAYSPPDSVLPPSTVMVELPAPRTLAPRQFRKLCKSPISGSRAALVMVVIPCAPTAHKMAFSVAPTLGRESCTSPPLGLP